MSMNFGPASPIKQMGLCESFISRGDSAGMYCCKPVVPGKQYCKGCFFKKNPAGIDLSLDIMCNSTLTLANDACHTISF